MLRYGAWIDTTGNVDECDYNGKLRRGKPPGLAETHEAARLGEVDVQAAPPAGAKLRLA